MLFNGIGLFGLNLYNGILFGCRIFLILEYLECMFFKILEVKICRGDNWCLLEIGWLFYWLVKCCNVLFIFGMYIKCNENKCILFNGLRRFMFFILLKILVKW